MANAILTSKTAITTPASGDICYIVDISDNTDNAAGSSRKITYANLTGGATQTELGYVSGVTSAIQTQMDLKAPLISPVLTTPQINDTSANHQYVVAVNELTADRTVTLPLLTGNDTFTFNDFAATLKNKSIDGDDNTVTDLAYSAIKSTSRSGSDATLITGTKGTSADLAVWNADGDLVDGPTPPSGTIVGISDTQTLTNKRVTKRVTTIVSSATPTVNTDNCDVVTITALAAAITSMTTNLSGTPTNFQTLIFRILDNATGRAITWGAKFEPRGVALPTTTTAGKLLTVGFIYDTVDSIWGCVASADEA